MPAVTGDTSLIKYTQLIAHFALSKCYAWLKCTQQDGPDTLEKEYFLIYSQKDGVERVFCILWMYLNVIYELPDSNIPTSMLGPGVLN